MFILNEFKGSTVTLDGQDRNLYQVLLRIAEIAGKDGFTVVIDQRIAGRIKVNLSEPWNLVLIEILTGLNLNTIIFESTIIIFLTR
jgi:hypothetical protein